MSRASRSRPSPYSSIRRSTFSTSRLATLTKTDRVTADGAVRTASATIAWLWRWRPTVIVRTGAETLTVGSGRDRAVGHDEDLGVAGPRRERRGEAERVGHVARRRLRHDALDRRADVAQVARGVGDDPGGPARRR